MKNERREGYFSFLLQVRKSLVNLIGVYFILDGCTKV